MGSDLVYVSDDLPDVGVHPQWEEEHAAELTEHQQKAQVVDAKLAHTLHRKYSNG